MMQDEGIKGLSLTTLNPLKDPKLLKDPKPFKDIKVVKDLKAGVYHWTATRPQRTSEKPRSQHEPSLLYRRQKLSRTSTLKRARTKASLVPQLQYLVNYSITG